MVEMYWSYELGKFLDKYVGVENCLYPDGRRMCSFCGNQREWNETLIEVLYDVSNTLLMRGMSSDAALNISIFAGSVVSSIMQTSVLYGRRMGSGVLLSSYAPDVRDPMSPDIDFVDAMTGKLLATVHVLDLPCVA